MTVKGIDRLRLSSERPNSRGGSTSRRDSNVLGTPKLD
eukprot:CAMPEP_0170471098 /NCGR_PEP_ID=MMETSP0123-20130129/13393_1 /TAXON_ID=182087 /ORGANISM="Favella ehrenbergii, Strain Fehren 1" /LENGTH=37 /DNA_ID= /DNA_START= /DNA_END= /DNA_ORIENTATION=